LPQIAGAWLAASNYLGYLAGALTASRLGFSLPVLMRVSLAGTVLTTVAMGAFEGLAIWAALRFLAGVMSAWTLVATSAWVLQSLARAGRTDLSGIVYAGVGAGIAMAGLFCLAAAQPGVPASRLWLELGALAALFIVVPDLVLGRRSEASAASRASPIQGGHERCVGLVISYGLLGFGYILPATFLPRSRAKSSTIRRSSGWLGPSLVSRPLCRRSQPLIVSVAPTGCVCGRSVIC
jgi:MFS family permease